MKIVRITSTAILSVLLWIAIPVNAQQVPTQKDNKPASPKQQQGKSKQAKPTPETSKPEPQQNKPDAEQAKPDQQQSKPDQAKPDTQQGKQEQARPEPQPMKQVQGKPDLQQGKQEQAKPDPLQSQPKQAQENQRVVETPQRTSEQHRIQQTAWQQHRSQRWESDHRTWQQRGGYVGFRIPQARYTGYFGPDHGFRIYGLPFLVVGGYPRFQYSGYWFSLVDPWPESWANDWYDTDQVYVTYVDNGYYLHNRRYPTVGIAISISL